MSEDDGREHEAKASPPTGYGGGAGSSGGGTGEIQGGDEGEDPRRVAHQLLGQAQAVLVLVSGDDVVSYWCPGEIAESFRESLPGTWTAFGVAQAAVASGRHDGELLEAGLGGAAGKPKWKLLRSALEKLAHFVGAERAVAIRSWIKVAAGAAKSAVSSMIKSIPGAEQIVEALDVVLNAVDLTEAIEMTW